MSDLGSILVPGSVAGVLVGLTLLVRGFAGYRRSLTVADVVTSRIATLAAGQVRISGTVEPAELSLVSPLQSHACVYYRAVVTAQEGRSRRTVFHDERAVGFRVRDASGAIRLFPRGATWDVPPALQARDGLAGDAPPDLELRTGPTYQAASVDRSALVAQLLTVHRDASTLDVTGVAGPLVGGLGLGGRAFEEARIEVGDVVTVVGTALPFDQLEDPDGASIDSVAVGGPLAAATDPVIAADLAAATAAGTLETDPAKAWGNAAIEGFGIGQPVRAPTLDPAANPEPVADAPSAARFRATFEIAPEEHVIAAAPGAPLLVSLGSPVAAVDRGRDQFVRGLAGAVLAVASVVVLAIELAGVAIR